MFQFTASWINKRMEAFKALNRLEQWNGISFECFEGDLTNVRGCKLKQSTRKLRTLIASEEFGTLRGMH
ncbi:MAG: hypothetical protein ACTS6P_01250 [Candidatus Hodgkinia cicadicola]